MTYNIIMDTDSYKVSHWKQYPPGTEYVYSYIEARGGTDFTVFFGLQMFIQEVLTQPITQEMIDEADKFWTAHGLPFNREGWQYILDAHGGHLPLEIRAVPEGMITEARTVLATVVNTDPKCFWLPGWVETALLRAVWYPTTVATMSWKIKDIIRHYMLQTCDNLDGLPFKLHDFGSRGVGAQEQAAIGGAAHLVNFMGTDTSVGAMHFMKHYSTDDMPGFSIPASEHSTITSWGSDEESEIAAYRNMIDQFAGEGKVYACVSDSYDIWNAVDKLWGFELIHEVEQRGGTLVIRPDSGNPVMTPVEVIVRLMNSFGCETNSKGYKVLPSCVRVIQGDGIGYDEVEAILHELKYRKISAENIAFGMGAGLLQKVNRDTYKFAMKCSAICVNGEWRNVSKNPVTDPGKRSYRGLVRPQFCETQSDDEPTVITTATTLNPAARYDEDLFPIVFLCGDQTVRYSGNMVRDLANALISERRRVLLETLG